MAISVWAYPEMRGEGGWKRASDLVKNPDFYSIEDYPDEEPCPFPEYQPKDIGIGDSRIYAALLISERHAWSTEPIKPIVSQRGFPIDASPDITAYYNAYKDSDTKASWLTLKELVEFPWGQHSFERSAMVSKEDAGKFREGQIGLPASVTSYSEYSSNGVRVNWTSTYLEAFGEQHLKSIFEELRRYGRPEDVRLVIWSDR